MTDDRDQPTIRIVQAAAAPSAPLGNVGDQRVLFGASRADGSPLLVGLTTLRAGQSSPLIQHDTAEIAYALLGAGSMLTNTSEHAFSAGDAILIESGCWHAIRAGDAAVHMLYVFPTPTAPTTRTHPSQQS